MRTVASLISEGALDELHVSPSPHARAGARLLAELLAGNSLPAGEEPPPWHSTAEAAPSLQSTPSAEASPSAEAAPSAEASPSVEAICATEADAVPTAHIDAIAQRRPTESVALLWTSLPTSPASMRGEILRRLREIDEAALRELTRFGVRTADVGQRVVALTALGDLTDESDEPLLAATDDPSPDVRLAALRALERRGSHSGLDAASRRILDPRPDVREAAVAVCAGDREKALKVLSGAFEEVYEIPYWNHQARIAALAPSSPEEAH